jgi:Arc/MetJ family transcription regulator
MLSREKGMKTTIVIDDELLKEAMKVTKSKTKKEAVETGLRELVRRENLEAFREELGTYAIGLTLEELEERRRDR